MDYRILLVSHLPIRQSWLLACLLARSRVAEQLSKCQKPSTNEEGKKGGGIPFEYNPVDNIIIGCKWKSTFT